MAMTNPFGYGDDLGLTQAGLSTAGLELTKWSPEVIRYGKDMLVFADFLENRTDRAFGKKQSETYTVPIYPWGDVATTALTPGTSITVDDIGTDAISITLEEYGRGIGKEGMVDYISNIDNRTEIQINIARQWADTFDALSGVILGSSAHMVYTVASAGSHSAVTTAAGNQKGTGTITGTLVDYLYDQLRASPTVGKFTDGLYRWVGNSETLRAVKREAGWENMQLYQRGPGLRTQILGAWKGFLFVETEENTLKGKSLVFGETVGAFGFAKPMTVYYYPDYHSDANRLQVFKWHTILGIGTTLRDKGTTCITVRTGMA